MKEIIETFKKTVDNIKNAITKLVDKIEENKKWKLFLYLSGQCIDVKKIDKDFTPMNKIYISKVKGMKHLLGTDNKVQILTRSYKYKYTDEIKKESHIEVIMYEGVEINE